MTGRLTDRRTLLTNAGLAAVALGTGLGASGCSKPVQLGTGALSATVPLAQVPVGGGIVLSDARFVVTQPTAGVYKAFDRTCTHQDCPVKKVEGGAIVCSCHGSRFSIDTGAVLTGPATKPLPARKAVIEGDHLNLSE